MSGVALQVRLLGTLAVLRDGAELPLPASRKVRALLAFLAVAPGPVSRGRLCELLWDGPDDPRGELRWCLSKLRTVVDDPAHRRIEAQGDTVALNPSDCFVDAAEVVRVTHAGVEHLDVPQLRALLPLFSGDFAEALETDRNPQFSSWLAAQRRRFQGLRAAVLEQLASRLAHDNAADALEYLEKWLEVTPFEERAHELLLSTLLRAGRVKEGEEHLAATIRLFEAEGLEWLRIREAWRSARGRSPEPASIMIAPSAERAGPGSALPEADAARARASICIMPFADRTTEGITRGGLADGLTEDIITRLARLRALFVIARGSVFALRERNIPPEEAGRLLNVDYVASGSVRRQHNRVVVTVELAETRMPRIVWVDEFSCNTDDAVAMPEEIGNRIVASIAEEVEASERNRAILRPPNSLNAWEAYHRGLWHMYRFSGEDNGRAAHFFQMALDQDRTFARAYAGLSFTHFQNVFLLRAADRASEIERAFQTAGESLVADDRDPAAHWAMGRALWLRGRQDDSLQELEQSLTLSPNFALGHYALGFVQSQSGDARVAIRSADYSRHLSPFDPLQFAMLATRAMALVRLGRPAEAADWAVKAAARPNAHVHILAIAANCLAAAGQLDAARGYVASARKLAPGYGLEDFFSAFRFAPDATALFRKGAGRAWQ